MALLVHPPVTPIIMVKVVEVVVQVQPLGQLDLQQVVLVETV